MFDIVIPLHEKDLYTIDACIESCFKNIQGLRKIYIVTNTQYSNSNVTIIKESIFPFTVHDIVSINPAIPDHRAGWYLQQLIKLHCHAIPGIADSVLILDSDVVFLRPVHFVSDTGEPLYSFSHEYTAEYFTCASKLNPYFERTIDVSGIAHNCMFQRKIIKEIFELINQQNNDQPWKNIIRAVENWHHGFSEYELYFHYIQKKYPQKFKLRKLNYEDVFDYKEYLNRTDLDYVANHDWKRKERDIIC